MWRRCSTFVGGASRTLSVDPTAAPGDVRQALARPAVPLPGAVAYGRINASETLAAFHPASQPAAPARATAVVRGTVGGQVRSRAYRLHVGAGDLTATLTFRKGGRLDLSLVSPRTGRPIVRTAGTGPLQLRRTLGAGIVRLEVAGGRTRASFVLTVSYVRRA